MSRSVGRPARGEARVTPVMMLDAALALLDSGGSAALTMRALGTVLGVNPMTIHHHFGGRDGLIAAIAEHLYVDVASPACAGPRARLEGLLRAYRAKVQQHPALTLEIFRSHAAFPAQARRISDSIVALLEELGVSPLRAVLWRDVLVDYLHGAALAQAMHGAGGAPVCAGPEPLDGRLDALTELLDALLLREASHRARAATKRRPSTSKLPP